MCDGRKRGTPLREHDGVGGGEEEDAEAGAAREEEEEEARLLRPARLRKVLWRDFAFLILGGVALKIINYVESHASDADLRGRAADEAAAAGVGIFDAGFALTAPLHRFLSSRRDWNDALALLNSLVLVLPNAYLAKVTLWDGDYTLSFRLLAAQLLRSLCGWFTYLPPDGGFLVSYYDFPEILQCLSQDCSAYRDDEEGEGGEVLPFVSFFSGHVATVVMAANHMYLSGRTRLAVAMHVLNVLQIVRLLATRGHYSIDIIIGWCVAIYVTNPAERLGRYYSSGITLRRLVVPGDARDAFERITGVYDVRIGGGGVGGGGARKDQGDGEGGADARRRHGDEAGPCVYCGEEYGDFATGAVHSDTAARILAETASDFAHRSLVDLRAELSEFGLQMQDLAELRHAEAVGLLGLARLRMRELWREARRFHGGDGGDGTEPTYEGMSRGEALHFIMERTKTAADRTARIAAGMAPEFARRSAAELRAEVMERAGLGLGRVQEMRGLTRCDLLRLLALAHLKAEELRAEARLLGVTLTEEMGRRDILLKIVARMRDAVLRTLRRGNSAGSDEGLAAADEVPRAAGELAAAETGSDSSKDKDV